MMNGVKIRILRNSNMAIDSNRCARLSGEGSKWMRCNSVSCLGWRLCLPLAGAPATRAGLRATGGGKNTRLMRARPVASSEDQANGEGPVVADSGAVLSIGEDAAAFDLGSQKAKSWALFFGLLTSVLGGIYALWIDPSIGIGSKFIEVFENTASSSEVTMLEILFVFAVVHSGLAFLRPYGEEAIGARAYRVLFALVSLPLAISAIVFFINHRYDGVALWNIRGLPLVHEAVWGLSFISFYFLYPSTFNILEVAAVDEPKLHLWETGIIRITRHPQAVGQLIWCVAHTAWVGSSFMVAASLGLMAHHAFGCWHGDYRLKRKYGESFEALKQRTSVIPFAAILDGRQELPHEYWKEFLRAPYMFLVPFCIGCYWCHPLMQRASLWLGW